MGFEHVFTRRSQIHSVRARAREKHLHMCYGLSWYLIAWFEFSLCLANQNQQLDLFFQKKNSIRRNRVYVVLLSFIFLHSLRSTHSEEILYHAQAYTRTCSSSSISSFFIYCIVYVVVVVLFLVD